MTIDLRLDDVRIAQTLTDDGVRHLEDHWLSVATVEVTSGCNGWS